jgi:MoaA/NifB/PqqE/SkfB family radical SAM enzyme
MKICKRALEVVQVINADGEVRLCGWLKDGGIIGRLSDHSMKEIYNSNEAKLIREQHVQNDHSNCNPNACPWMANENIEENLVELEEFPEYPTSLYLGYENVCNYRCVMCTIPDCTKGKKKDELEQKLNKVDHEIRKVLPYIKNISANGLGELFVSKHILKLLAEWKPLANPEDCSVGLESNGALFNEENWKKIENLGQYHVSLTITVLSFENEVYQELSGTSLPVSNVLANLSYVKSLREQGVINFLEIATVYQEKNFRQLPEFTRRCIEEFGADSVRLRPFEPWRDASMQDWYKDVRNEYHPHHKEFLEVMKDPIFKHPKVHDWGGQKVSGLGPEPYPWTRARYHLLENVLCDDGLLERVHEKISTNKVIVYGMHSVGRALTSLLKTKYQIPYCIDRGMDGREFVGVPIYGVNKLEHLDRNATVIVALDKNEDSVLKLMQREGYEQVVSIKEFVEV